MKSCTRCLYFGLQGKNGTSDKEKNEWANQWRIILWTFWHVNRSNFLRFHRTFQRNNVYILFAREFEVHYNCRNDWFVSISRLVRFHSPLANALFNTCTILKCVDKQPMFWHIKSLNVFLWAAISFLLCTKHEHATVHVTLSSDLQQQISDFYSYSQ